MIPGPCAASTGAAVTTQPDGANIVVLLDHFPELSETFVLSEIRALMALGDRVRVESRGPAATPNWEDAEGIPCAFAADDPRGRKLRDLAWLATRHPLRCLVDLRERRMWEADEHVAPLRSLAPVARRVHRHGARHLHVHFAKGAALDALRVGRLLARPYSLTAHAFDIYLAPANLARKLRGSAFTTSGCDYTVADLREIAGEADADRVHRIVMGVDGGALRRTRPHGTGRSVVAVGRLVEKKGFRHLLDAAAHLERIGEPLDHVAIVGEGPLAHALARQRRELGLEHRVTFHGAQAPERVRAHIAAADVLAMPCVIASDGDRDSMPVVVKEAMALEVLVVASDEVGLPEVVQAPWGRLAPPGDPVILAQLLDAALSLDAAERAAAGAAARTFVSEHCDVLKETRRLRSLFRNERQAPLA